MQIVPGGPLATITSGVSAPRPDDVARPRPNAAQPGPDATDTVRRADAADAGGTPPVQPGDETAAPRRDLPRGSVIDIRV